MQCGGAPRCSIQAANTPSFFPGMSGTLAAASPCRSPSFLSLLFWLPFGDRIPIASLWLLPGERTRSAYEKRREAGDAGDSCGLCALSLRRRHGDPWTQSEPVPGLPPGRLLGEGEACMESRADGDIEKVFSLFPPAAGGGVFYSRW